MPEPRLAQERDLPAIEAIYRPYAETTPATFDVEPLTLQEWRAKWSAAAAAEHPWLVTEDHGAVLGYAISGAFRPKAAYRATVETTIYLDNEATGRGLGKPLYEALLAEATRRGFHLAVAGITLPNAPSVAMHEALGFTPVGVFEEVGHKFGQWHDVAWWQLRLSDQPGGRSSTR